MTQPFACFYFHLNCLGSLCSCTGSLEVEPNHLSLFDHLVARYDSLSSEKETLELQLVEADEKLASLAARLEDAEAGDADLAVKQALITGLQEKVR